MSCGGGTNTTTQVQSVPAWVEDAGKSTYQKASDFYSQGYQPYTGQRVAPMNATQTGAMAQMSAYTPPDVTNKAMGLVDAATAPASTERVVDQNGRLGAISDYFDPYVGAALQPAIDAIMRSYTTQRKGIDSNAMSAHAFGDARQGVMEGRLGADTSKAVGDTTAQAYEAAYQNAMSERGSDLDRFASTDAANRSNDLAGAAALPGIATADQNTFLQRMQAMLGIGQVQQQQDQNQLDVDYQSYAGGQQDQYDRLAALVSALGSVPYTRTSSTTSPKPGLLPQILGVAGSVAGAALGM